VNEEESEKEFVGVCECGCGQQVKPGQRFIQGHNVRLILYEVKKKAAEKGNITRKRKSEIKLGIRPPPEPMLCACGCGKKAKLGNRYIIGHNQQGKHHSEAHKKYLSAINIGENHPMFGTHPSEKTRQKMSDSHIGNPGFWTGKKFSAEHVKNISKTHTGKNGDKGSNWQGGISFLPYCEKFTKEFKERVRDFFGRCCYLCAKNEIDNGRKLSVHHVNYQKDACCIDEVRPLFVPLCQSCHSKVHNDRDGWEKFFTLSLDFLTDGKCFTPKGDR